MARRESQVLMGLGVAGTVEWNELGGWALVEVMPVTPGPAPPATLPVPASTRPSLLPHPGFNPQSLWRGWCECVVFLTALSG